MNYCKVNSMRQATLDGDAKRPEYRRFMGSVGFTSKSYTGCLKYMANDNRWV